MNKRITALFLAGVMSVSAFHSVAAAKTDEPVKETYTIEEATQGFIDAVEPEKNLTAGESVPILNEDELLSGFCVSLYAGEQPSGYVVIKNTTDGVRVSEFATELGVENLYAQLMDRPAAKEIRQAASPAAAQAAEETEKVIYSFDTLDYKVAAEGTSDSEQAVFVDYDNQRLDKQAFKEAKAAAKEQKKQAKEERKKQKEELKALKKAKKEQEKADKKAAKTLPYAGQEIDLSQVTVEQIEEAQQALETQAEYVPFAQTSSDVVDGYKAVIDYNTFVNIAKETKKSNFLSNVFNYKIMTQPYVYEHMGKYACAVVAMTNAFSWLKANGYEKILKNNSYVDTYNALWDYSETTFNKDENGNETTSGSTHVSTQGPAMERLAKEQGYKYASTDGYWLVLYSDFKRDINQNLPCFFVYGAANNFCHEVFVTGYIETETQNFLYVASGWLTYEDVPGADEHDFKFYHRYIDLKQKFDGISGFSFHIGSNPDYK